MLGKVSTRRRKCWREDRKKEKEAGKIRPRGKCIYTNRPENKISSTRLGAQNRTKISTGRRDKPTDQSTRRPSTVIHFNNIDASEKRKPEKEIREGENKKEGKKTEKKWKTEEKEKVRGNVKKIKESGRRKIGQVWQ